MSKRRETQEQIQEATHPADNTGDAPATSAPVTDEFPTAADFAAPATLIDFGDVDLPDAFKDGIQMACDYGLIDKQRVQETLPKLSVLLAALGPKMGFGGGKQFAYDEPTEQQRAKSRRIAAAHVFMQAAGERARGRSGTAQGVLAELHVMSQAVEGWIETGEWSGGIIPW